METTLPKESIKRLRFLGSSDDDFTGKAYTKDQKSGFVRLEIDVVKWDIFGMEMAYGKSAKISIAPKEITLIFKNRQISRVDVSFKNGTHIISNCGTDIYEPNTKAEFDNLLDNLLDKLFSKYMELLTVNEYVDKHYQMW